jgi:hypothetical protein
MTRWVFEKNRPKMLPNLIFVKNNTLFCAQVNSSTKMWASSVIFRKLPEVNNSPSGENSPNLVIPTTLLYVWLRLCIIFCKKFVGLCTFRVIFFTNLSGLPAFCWAKLNHRTLSSTPPKFGNDCQPPSASAGNNNLDCYLCKTSKYVHIYIDYTGY